ncbi:flagellar export protein FliJ [Pseudomonadota bacterium]
MARSKRIKPIVSMAHNLEREAARALGEALAYLDENVKQLNLLFTYREEYNQKLQASGSQGMSGQELNEYRQFIKKIADAIENQQKAIDQAKQNLEEKKQFWFAKRGRSKALDKVLDRYLDDERRQQEKRLQKELDDRAGQKTPVS